jgi:purine-cytosine permease-like protein
MPSTSTEAPNRSRYPFTNALIALPALVAIFAWIVQYIAKFEPATKGAGLTALALVVGSALSAVTAAVGIVRLVRSPTSRSVAGYSATLLALIVGLVGLLIAFALISGR